MAFMYMYFENSFVFLGVVFYIGMINQRTNGPVNAYLTSGPSTYQGNKQFYQIRPCHKIGQGQPMVIIYTNFVDLESLMVHAKFQDHETSGSEEEDF